MAAAVVPDDTVNGDERLQDGGRHEVALVRRRFLVALKWNSYAPAPPTHPPKGFEL